MVTGCLRMIKRAPDGSFGWWVRKWSLDWHGILHLSISEPYFCQNIKISTSVWSVQHPNASWNIQHLIAANTFFPIHNTIHTFFNTRQVKKSQSWELKKSDMAGFEVWTSDFRTIAWPINNYKLTSADFNVPKCKQVFKDCFYVFWNKFRWYLASTYLPPIHQFF